ncbi:hypothetical protein ACROYT_G012651 [Oculina patagonica]
MASDKVRKDAIALGNRLTFKQVYDLVKVEESTKAQIKIISKGDKKSDLHTVQRESAYSTERHPPRQSYTHQASYGDQSQRDHTEENLAVFNLSQRAASDAETPMIDQRIALPRMQNASTVARLALSNVLRGYGGSEIENLGVATLKVSFKDKSANIKFNVVEAPGSPSMLGC